MSPATKRSGGRRRSGRAKPAAARTQRTRRPTRPIAKRPAGVRSRAVRPQDSELVVNRPSSVGERITRIEGREKVTGRALYVDDLEIAGLMHGRTVRSTIARGRIKKITFDNSFDWSDVVVADHRDIPGDNLVALIEEDQPLLVVDEVRHADEPILLLAHENPEVVDAATRAISIEYEELDPVLTVEDSLAKKALIHGDDNVLKRIVIERGDVERGFAEADVIVENEYRTGHQEQLYIENNGMIAERTEDGGLLVRGSLQCPYYIHEALMRAFDLPADKVRVIQTTTGGGFGGKEEYPSMIGGHAALLAWKCGRPVKLVYDRFEDIAATTKRHPAVMRLRTGIKRNGTLVANQIDVVMDGGAYVTLSPVVLSRGALHAGGPYRCPNVSILARAVATNTPPNGAFRGFGAPQTEFAMECHMNRIAHELGLDPVELRRRNVYRVGDVTPTSQVMKESVGTEQVLERTVEISSWRKTRARYERENAAAERAERSSGGARRDGRRVRRGIGMALAYHGAGFTGSGEVRLKSKVAMDLTHDGRPRVLAASTEIGQGTITIFSQMAAEALGVPATLVVVEWPDTAVVPNSGPTVASRTCMVVGGLVAGCAQQMREKLELFAERPFRDATDFQRIARKYLSERGEMRVEQTYKQPPHIEWDEDRYQGDAYGCYSYAACTVEVEVDLDTFETTLLDVKTAQDIGTVIHPLLAAGQIEGGTVQGLGYALLEEVRWKDGRVWNNQLTNYIIPTSMDTPPIRVEMVEVPYRYGPYGAKGVGELPMDVPAPAVVAAIAHAVGVHAREIPVTPERLLDLMTERDER